MSRAATARQARPVARRSTDTEASPADRKALAKILRDPAEFSRRIFTDSIWSKQEEILRAIAKPHSSVAVKGCHASAKTHAAARAALWFVTRYDDGIVVTTAPKEDQLELLLWKEIRSAMAQSRIAYPEPLTTALKLSEKNYMTGLVAKDATRFQGFHAPHLLFIVDEAPGVANHIFEAIEGARAGGDVRILMLGNPTIISGPFYDAFTRERRRWRTISISAFDSPNLAGITLEDIQAITSADDPLFATQPMPWLATRRWVWEKWDSWGRHGHPLWQARVLGEFPDQAEDALIALSWVEHARSRVADVGAGELVAGVDVAGPGEDETVLVLRAAGNIVLEKAWPNPDPRGELVNALRPFKEHIAKVKVDTVGIGYYLARHLQDDEYTVEDINVGLPARDGERFKNAKAEFYWALREAFQDGHIAGAMSEEMVSQLCGVRYNLNGRGQIEIESKDDARKRGVKSPDRAEALMLSFAQPTQPGMGFFGFVEEQGKAAVAAEQERLTVDQLRRANVGELVTVPDPDREARLRAYEEVERRARR